MHSTTNRRFASLMISSGLLLTLATACQTVAPARTETAGLRFQCERGSAFSVENRGTTAMVRFDDGSYRLHRNPSSLGERFTSPEATLIIDGDFAAFVAKDRLDLQGCMSTESVARARTPGV